MANKNIPNNPYFEQYVREYQRLTQVFRRMKRKGYIIPEEIKPLKPSKVKNVTKSEVEWLINLTPKEIRERSYYVNPVTGTKTLGLDVVKSSHKAKASIQKARLPKGRKTGIKQGIVKSSVDGEIPPIESNLNLEIIERISDLLQNWSPASYWNTTWVQRKTQYYVTIYSLWSNTLSTEGEYEVAYRMENKAQYYYSLIDRLIHGSDSVWEDQMNLTEFIQLLINRPLTAEESDYYSETAREYIQDTIIGDSFG